jgi:hypothetical protein
MTSVFVSHKNQVTASRLAVFSRIWFQNFHPHTMAHSNQKSLACIQQKKPSPYEKAAACTDNPICSC